MILSTHTITNRPYGNAINSYQIWYIYTEKNKTSSIAYYGDDYVIQHVYPFLRFRTLEEAITHLQENTIVFCT